MPALLDAATAQLKKNRANTALAKNGKPAHPHRGCKTVLQETTCGRTPANGSGKVCNGQKKGKFRTIVDKSVDIHRMTCA